MTADTEQQFSERRACSCEWDPGDGYTTPPSPISICEFCEGGMDQQQRIGRAMNQYRMRLNDECRQAVRRAMNAAGLHPYAGLTGPQQQREVEETLAEREAEHG